MSDCAKINQYAIALCIYDHVIRADILMNKTPLMQVQQCPDRIVQYIPTILW